MHAVGSFSVNTSGQLTTHAAADSIECLTNSGDKLRDILVAQGRRLAMDGRRLAAYLLLLPLVVYLVLWGAILYQRLPQVLWVGGALGGTVLAAASFISVGEASDGE
jgi:hypothetical protein